MDADELTIGGKVQVHSLTTIHYNGMMGRVTSPAVMKKGVRRVQVSIKLSNGTMKVLALQPKNLLIMPPPDPDLQRVLYAAVSDGNSEVIRQQVQLGADVEGAAALCVAAKQGHVGAITTLVDLGADVNTPDKWGMTPVHIAVRYGHREAVLKLVDLGANVNTPNIYGARPMHTAALYGYNDIISTLVDLGAKVNTFNHDGASPVYLAACAGHAHTIDVLKLLGANVNIRHKGCNTPAFGATYEGHVDVLKTLVRLGADINTFSNDGTTLAYAASSNNHIGILRVIGQLGVDFNEPGKFGSTALGGAAYFGYADAIRVLVELGAQVNIIDRIGCTPVMLASREGFTDAIRVLVELGADINVIVMEEMTPLVATLLDVDVNDTLDIMCCNHSDNFSSFQFLLSVGADISSVQNLYSTSRYTVLDETLDVFCDRCAIPNTPEINLVFSLTNLITSTFLSSFTDSDNPDASDDTENTTTHAILETSVAHVLLYEIEPVTIDRLYQAPYPFRRRLTRVGCRVLQHSLATSDGDRISLTTKAQRCAQLTCLLLDEVMLREVLALRLTCKSNHQWRRFPVVHDAEHELEVNLIERFLGYDASRFVSTQVLHGVLNMHERLKGDDQV